MTGQDINVWVDASSLVVFEDACWLPPANDAQYINLAELDAALKGINLVLQWKCKVMHLKTDSVSVYHWLVDTLTRKTRIRTKATSEMLLRRRLETIKPLVEEYGWTVSMDVALIPSIQDLADSMIRVLQRWLERMKSATKPVPLCCAARSNGMTNSQIMKVNGSSGYPGIRHTTYFARRVCPTITKADVRSAIRACEQCQMIDPAPVHWTKGGLAVKANWQRLGIDITHYNGKHFRLRSSMFYHLAAVAATGLIIQHLEAIFFEHDQPQELLADNDIAFSSGEFRELSANWGVRLRFRCACVPAGNGIVEWCQRSIKRIAARTRCFVQEAVYWYNVTPKDDTSSLTAPANGIYRYEVRIRNIDPVPTSPASTQNRYRVGDPVWIKPPRYRCMSKFQEGTVTEVISPQIVIVDGVPRHVMNVQPRKNAILFDGTDDEDVRPRTNARTDDETSVDTGYITMPGRQAAQNGKTSEPPLRRSTRRRLPTWPCLCCDQGAGRSVENAWRGKHHGGGLSNGNARAGLDRKQDLYSFE